QPQGDDFFLGAGLLSELLLLLPLLLLPLLLLPLDLLLDPEDRRCTTRLGAAGLAPASGASSSSALPVAGGLAAIGLVSSSSSGSSFSGSGAGAAATGGATGTGGGSAGRRMNAPATTTAAPINPTAM